MSFKKPFRAVPIQLGKRYRAKRRIEKARHRAVPIMGLAVAAAAVGAFVSIVPPTALSSLRPGYDDTASGCTATDGDTIRRNGEPIRLLGVDTPELPGHCHEGRDCDRGDPCTATRSLTDALIGRIQISRVGVDHYGRTLATLSTAKGDLSCSQLQHGQAVYKPQWDDGKRVLRTCPMSALL